MKWKKRKTFFFLRISFMPLWVSFSGPFSCDWWVRGCLSHTRKVGPRSTWFDRQLSPHHARNCRLRGLPFAPRSCTGHALAFQKSHLYQLFSRFGNIWIAKHYLRWESGIVSSTYSYSMEEFVLRNVRISIPRTSYLVNYINWRFFISIEFSNNLKCLKVL